MAQESVKMCRWSRLLARAFSVKKTVGSSASCADLWVLPFIRDILVKGWKAVGLQWACVGVVMLSTEQQVCPSDLRWELEVLNSYRFHSVESKLVSRYSRGLGEGWPLLAPWHLNENRGGPCLPVGGICQRAQICFCPVARRPWWLCWACKVLLPGPKA